MKTLLLISLVLISVGCETTMKSCFNRCARNSNVTLGNYSGITQSCLYLCQDGIRK